MYAKDKITAIYLCRSNLPLEDSLVAIETDEVVRELIRLLENHEFVCVYVEYVDDENAEGRGRNEEGNGIEHDSYLANADNDSSDRLSSEGLDVFSSDVNGEDLEDAREKKKRS